VSAEPAGDPRVDVERWRREFPILADSVYMISNSLGAMPARARDSLAAYAETWATRGVRAWEEGWWEMAGALGDLIGQIVGAAPGSVCMQENVTTAHMTVLSSLEPRPGRRTIVSTAMDFPSVLYLFQAQAPGMELRLAPGEPDLSVRTERLVEAIDESTLVVAISHVLFRSSYIMDAAAVIEKAHRVGAPVILDVYQSAGIVPLDLGALGVDYAVGGCLKWLCGGPGTGFLYTRPDRLASTTPRFTGWVAHRDPFAFDPSGLEPRADALKLMNGTPPIPAFYAARPGLEIVREVGVEAIRARSKRMTAHLMERIDALGFRFNASRDPERVAGTVALDVPDARFVARTLKRRDFLVDYRPRAGIRISPHFYNTFEELDRVLDETERIVREKDYDPGEPFGSVVT